ncbi:unnamed protein product [Didymodactylos carnosus]|uniref:Sulfotransferase domain-containing protein n=1 Tax=Didymodactylos carnosus TaxID=1234261 RepID=A0A813ZP33_9BILA|nr:unnamed protein product [Didymodactylos carnosus]CAF0901812.1 unnamed protein product [Didymodactylos carnosus]CAF3556955.1 unnamed protein product [Didymodactylos carnosus]CAF3684177.1 unnamed protein product [Didymodactylos carnosus]
MCIPSYGENYLFKKTLHYDNNNLTLNNNNNNNNNTGEINQHHLPKAIIIGVKKCGTRALLKFISAHPDVAASLNEVHFFDQNYHNGLDWYRNQMPLSSPHQITMEKTPQYFINNRSVYRIAKTFSNIDLKLIIIIRNPIIRAISDYVQLTTKRKSNLTFEDYVFIKNSTIVNEQWTPLKIGCYSRYLIKWLKYFSLNQIHFVDGENLIKRPWEELLRVQQFLNLTIHIQRKHFYFNRYKRSFPCIKDHFHPTKNGCLGSSKGRKHPKIRDETRIVLENYYKTCNNRLKQIAKINFPWL